MATQKGGKPPILGPILASEDTTTSGTERQGSAIRHGTYTKAHAGYAQMTSVDLQAHQRALRDVQAGKKPATKQQLSSPY
jgi:hypothetical protein